MPVVTVEPLVDAKDVAAGFALWNDEHPAFYIDDRYVDRTVYAPTDVVAGTAWGVRDGHDLVGFAFAKRLTNEIPGYAGPETGWISLLALRDDRVHAGEELLSTATNDLADRGVERIHVGKDVQHLLAGLPARLADRYHSVLSASGYERGESVYDVGRDITAFDRPPRVAATLAADEVVVRRLDRRDTSALGSLLADQFPGRWQYGGDRARRIPGGIEAYWGVWKAGELVGFARTSRCDGPVPRSQLTFGDRVADRYCGLGPIGVHEDARGNGFGLALLSRAIESLRDDGYPYMIIDWTTILAYYGKLGFEPILEYVGYTNESAAASPGSRRHDT